MTPALPSLSIITVTRNRAAELRATLRELPGHLPAGAEMIVVANACTDETVPMLRQEHPWVRLVERDDNQAMAATNFGLEVARGEIIMVLDDDALPEPGTIPRALERFAREPGLQAMAPAVVEQGRVVNAHWPATGLNFVGCGAFFRRATLQGVGGYSRDIPWAGNEKELSCRWAAAGFTVDFDPVCRVIHRKSPVNRAPVRDVWIRAEAVGYRYGRYHFVSSMPFAALGAVGYQARRVPWWWLPIMAPLAAGRFVAGLVRGARKRSRLSHAAALRAGELWRLQLRGAGRHAARLLPRTFWW